MSKNGNLYLAEFSMLVAIEALFCFTPLGSLPAFGPIVATLAMVPVIITTLLLGIRAGTAMGFIAGLFSFIVWTFMPPTPVSAFIFTPFYSFGEIRGNFGSILICFVPRILVGVVAGGIYKTLTRVLVQKDYFNMIVSSVLGSLANTLGVMVGIWAFFGAQYSFLVGQSILFIIGTTILTSGIPEAVVSAILAPAVCKPIKDYINRR